MRRAGFLGTRRRSSFFFCGQSHYLAFHERIEAERNPVQFWQFWLTTTARTKQTSRLEGAKQKQDRLKKVIVTQLQIAGVPEEELEKQAKVNLKKTLGDSYIESEEEETGDIATASVISVT